MMYAFVFMMNIFKSRCIEVGSTVWNFVSLLGSVYNLFNCVGCNGFSEIGSRFYGFLFPNAIAYLLFVVIKTNFQLNTAYKLHKIHNRGRNSLIALFIC